jgi:translocation and assembly module TamB
MRARTRWLLRIGAALLALLALPALLLVAVLVLPNLQPGREAIEQLTAALSHGQVSLQGLAGRFPDELHLAQLRIADPQGVWLEVDALQLQWSPLRLLERRGSIQSLQAARVSVARAPAYPPGKSSSSGGIWIHSLELDQFLVQRLELGAALTGTAVTARLQGNARFYSWEQANWQLAAQRLDSVAATYRSSGQIDEQNVQGQLELEEAAEGPLSHLAQLPQLGALALHLKLQGPRQAVQAALDLRAGALHATAGGTLDLRAQSAQLQIDMQSANMRPRADLAWQGLTLQGQWRGTLAAPVSTARLQLTGLQAGSLQLSSLQAQLQGQGNALSLDASAAGLALPAPVLTLLQAAPLALHLQARLGQRGRPIDFSVSHPLLQAQGHWDSAGEGAARLSARLPQLQPFAAMAGLDLRGRGSLDAQLSAGIRRDLTLSGELQVDGGEAPLASLLGPRAQLQGRLSIAPARLEVEQLRLEAPQLYASLQGSDRDGALQGQWSLRLPSLAALSPALLGHLDASGELQGSAPHLALTAAVNGELAAHGAPSGPLRLRLSARDLPARPSGRLDLSGTLDGAPLRLAASLDMAASGALSLQIEHGDWKSAHLEGAVHSASLHSAPQGRIALSMQQLSDLDRLLGLPLQGSLAANGLFDGTGTHGQASIDLSASNVGLPAQQLQQLQLQGEIEDPMRHPVLALKLSAQALLQGHSSLLQAEAHGPLDALNLVAEASGAGDAQSAWQLHSSALLHANASSLQLLSLRADYRAQALQLLEPATVSYGDGVALEHLRLGFAGSVLQLQGRLTPTLQLDASWHDFAPASLAQWLPVLDTAGTLSADATLSGTLSRPQGSLHLSGTGLRPNSTAARGLPASNLDARVQLGAGSAQLQLQVGAGKGLQLQLDGTVPLARDAAMALKVSGSFDLNLVNPILEARGQRLLGQARIEAEFDGTLANPQAHGTLAITHGDLQDYARGAHLSQINATFSADGSNVRIEQFNARAGPGTLAISGNVGLGEAQWPVNVKVSAHNAQPLASDLLTANLELDLSLSGDLRGRMSAAGSVRINHADINIPNALPPSVETLNVVRAGQRPPASGKASLFVVDLNLKLNAPRAVFVRGRGVDAELGGEVDVRGNSDDPLISGGFDLRNGTLSLAGSTLTFTSGRVSFNGTGVRKKIDPTLDFTATNTTAGITANLNVGGYADAPVITLSSTPEMPQDQILSWLLFGSGVSQLSGLQIAQIGAALASMSGVGGNGGFNPINTVQRKLGLDRLAINGGGTTGAAPGAGATGAATSSESTLGPSIEAGRYVTSRVYIGAKQFENGPTQAQVQINLTKRLKLQTTLATGGGTLQGATPQNDPGSSVGLSYQFDY